MGKTLVSDLSDGKLDYWVGRAQGLNVYYLIDNEGKCWLNDPNQPLLVSYSPSTNWLQGGQIMEDNAITVTPISDAEWQAEEHITLCQARGLTYLIAAMRCYVVSVFGEYVE